MSYFFPCSIEAFSVLYCCRCENGGGVIQHCTLDACAAATFRAQAVIGNRQTQEPGFVEFLGTGREQEVWMPYPHPL